MLTQEQIECCDAAIAAIAKGEMHALGMLYECMAHDVLIAALAITRSHADAEDALQDTMLQIVRYASRYRQGTDPRAWVLTIARHRAIDIVRRRKKTTSLEEACLVDESDVVDGMNVISLLDALTRDERLIVILRLYHTLSYEDIAKVMGISTYAAQKRYQRSLQKLKKQNMQ